MSDRSDPTRRRLLGGIAGLGAVAALSAAGLLRPGAAAAAQKGIPMSPRDKEDLDRVEKYLNGIKSMQARFQQWTKDGGISRGTIYLRRPGKMRIEYDPPTPVLIVADGSMISYYDSELDQLNQAPLSSSPAWFLLRERITLGKDVTVTEMQRAPGALKVSMFQTEDPDEGSVSLILRDDPMELQQWTIVDPQKNQIRIGLFDASFGVPLEPRLFATPRVVRRGTGKN
jgi:outer membrane lipoprotein-sorting protein